MRRRAKARIRQLPGAALHQAAVTGVCNDARPVQFLMTDASLEDAQGCVWRTEELQTKPDEAVVFRAQDCTGEQWDRTVYSWVGNYVKAKLAPVPDDQAVRGRSVRRGRWRDGGTGRPEDADKAPWRTSVRDVSPVRSTL